MEYLDNSDVVIINVLSDMPNATYDCVQWGANSDDRIPLIVDDENYDGVVRDWFGFSQWVMPQYIFIDEDFKFYAKTQSEGTAENILEEMLENLNGE